MRARVGDQRVGWLGIGAQCCVLQQAQNTCDTPVTRGVKLSRTSRTPTRKRPVAVVALATKVAARDGCLPLERFFFRLRHTFQSFRSAAGTTFTPSAGYGVMLLAGNSSPGEVLMIRRCGAAFVLAIALSAALHGQHENVNVMRVWMPCTVASVWTRFASAAVTVFSHPSPLDRTNVARDIGSSRPHATSSMRHSDRG